MVVLLLSSRGARLIDLEEPLPNAWRILEARPRPLPNLPAVLKRRLYKRVDFYTYVEQEPSDAAA